MTSLQSNVAAAYLIIEQNRRWSDVYRLTLKGTTRLGRSSQNQIVVSDDRSSRFHAEIQFIEKRWMLQDLNSRNGTLVDGKPITGLHALQSGQTIQIGGCIYRFTNKLAVAAKSNSQGNLSSPAHTSQSDQSELQSQRFTGTNLNLEGLAAIQSQAAGKASVHPIGREQPRRWVTEMSVAMMEAPSFADAAAVALQIILQHCKVEAGAILSIEGNNIATILSTAQKPGRAYRRIADSLVTQCVQSNQALLARNFEAESSQIICAPINNGKTTIGLIHIYSEAGDTALDAKSLVEVTAAAEALSVTLPHLRQQGKLRRQLKRTKTQLEALSSQLDQDTAQGQMVGHSKVLENLKERLKRVARSDSTLLLRGESGVGKGLAARFTHWQSPRKSQPFLSVNCAALTASMLESELFGHEKGGVPGAMTRKIGKFELADGGTLMLDEVGAMSAELQTKFLSVLEGQPFERVGGSEPIATDVRIVAATNRDLEQAVQAGHFRDDLYFRLRVVELTVPPLRKRADDIVPLAQAFLAKFRDRSGYGPTGFTAAATKALQSHRWPGNIRELKNCVERAFVLASGELAEVEDLALVPLIPNRNENPSSQQPSVRTSESYVAQSIAEIEQQHIAATLEHTNGQKSRAAEILGIERSTLDRKLKKIL